MICDNHLLDIILDIWYISSYVAFWVVKTIHKIYFKDEGNLSLSIFPKIL